MWKNSGAFIRWAQTSQSPCVFVGIFGRFCQKIKMGNINLFVVGKMLEYLGLVGRFQNKIPKFSLCFSAEQNCGLNKNPPRWSTSTWVDSHRGWPFRIWRRLPFINSSTTSLNGYAGEFCQRIWGWFFCLEDSLLLKDKSLGGLGIPGFRG